MAGLDGLGSADRGDNVTLGMTAKKLFEVGGFILSKASQNLQRGGHNAAGKLDRDMKLGDLEVNGTTLALDLLIPEYGLFLDQGVNGVEKKHGSPFSFKTKKVGRKMAASLLAWARRRSLRADKYKPLSKGGKKDQALRSSVDNAKKFSSLAYGIATNIKKNGIKPTKFFSKAIASGSIKYKELIAEGLKIDIINSLKDGNNNTK